MTFYLPPSLPGNKWSRPHALLTFHTCCSILKLSLLAIFISSYIQIICIALIYVTFTTTPDIHRPTRYIGIPFLPLLPRSAMMCDSRPWRSSPRMFFLTSYKHEKIFGITPHPNAVFYAPAWLQLYGGFARASMDSESIAWMAHSQKASLHSSNC